MGTTYNEHFRELFTTAVDQLAGSPQQSLLKQFCVHKAEQGEVIYLDGINASDAVTKTAMGSAKTREKFAAIEAPDVDDVIDLKTPFHKVNRQRTLLSGVLLEWGHAINDEKKIGEMIDPTNPILLAGMSTFWTGEDELILAALAAATVTRGRNSGNTSAIAFPAGQKLEIDGSDTDNISVEAFGDIQEIFRVNYVKAEPIVLVVSPWFAKTLKKTSKTEVTSKDFVDSGRFFETGEIPRINGIAVIEHPLLQVTAGETEYAYAWTPNGITLNQFKAMEKQMAIDPGMRFELVTYVSEWLNAARVDDLRVVQITVTKSGS